LETLNEKMQTLMLFIFPFCAITEVALQNIGGKLIFLVSQLLVFMTFSGNINMRFKDIKAFFKYPIAMLYFIMLLYIYSNAI